MSADPKTEAIPAATSPDVESDGDRTIVELAIERALDTVAAELEVVAESEAARIADQPGDPAKTDDAPMTPEVAVARLAAVAAARRPADQPAVAAAAPQPSPPPAAAAAPVQPKVAEDAPPRPDAPRPIPEPAQLTQLLAQVSPPATVEELRRAVSRAGGRDLEELLEAIMRPAVREWLANNMSTLAERIVREEIERVSRPRD